MDITMQHVGKHAGTVWKTLEQQGSLSEKKLEQNTKLSTDELHSAIGWLAREGKIGQQENTYYIGDTNLTPRIGKNAGMIWKILDIWEEADITSITHLARIDKTDAYAALGWLAREGKIMTTMKKKKSYYVLKE